MKPLMDFLESVRHHRLEQERLRMRIAELESRCTKITASLSSTPGSGGSDAQRQWAALADERTKLTDALRDEIDAAAQVEDWIKALPFDPLLIDTLLYRYINLLTVPEITRAFERAGTPYSQRQIERFLAAALAMAWMQWKGEHA